MKYFGVGRGMGVLSVLGYGHIHLDLLWESYQIVLRLAFLQALAVKLYHIYSNDLIVFMIMALFSNQGGELGVYWNMGVYQNMGVY